MSNKSGTTTGVILAGGRATRMNNADKPLLELAGKPLLAHILANACTQVDRLILSVNHNSDRYEHFGVPLVKDTFPGYAGPLAGILAAIDWTLRTYPDTSYIASFPGDVPFFPPDLITLLRAEAESGDYEITWLSTDGQLQPLFALWSVRLRDPLEKALFNQVYSPIEFITSCRHCLVKLRSPAKHHFVNINRPEDLEMTRSLFTDIPSSPASS